MAKVTKKKLKDYLQDSKNFNQGTEYGTGLIAKSVSKFGAGRSMLASSDGVLVAGNKSHQALADAGIENVIEVETDGKTAVVVKRTDIKSGTKKFHELALADNATSKANLNFDETLVEEILTEEVMLEWGVGNPKAEEDDYTPPPLDEIKTDIVRGDIFEITNGKLVHRLLCGDSTVKEDVEKLMNGQKADMVFTDPPYGVNYEGGLNDKKREKLKGDSDANLYSGALIQSSLFAKSSAPIYLWFADRSGKPVYEAVEANGYKVRAMIVWNKLNAHYGNFMAQYMQKHEPCLYCVKDKPNWYGATNEVTVWDITQPSKNEHHPTQKPVELATRALNNSSKTEDNILDLFGGSGTTMVASHQLGRNCYMIEIMPQYCQIILDRMAKLDNSLKFTKNGKPYKITPVESADKETGKAPTKGTKAATAPKEAGINA